MAITCSSGASSHIRFSAASGTLPQTVAMWFLAPDVTNDIEIFNNANNFQLLLNGSGADKLLANDDVGSVVTSTNAYTANTWHHAAAYMLAGSSAGIYLNGSKNTGSGGGSIGGGVTLRFGNTTSASVLVAELALWSVQLTDAEVAMLALGLSPALVRPQSLLHYLPCIRNVADVWRSTTIAASGGAVADHPRIFYRRSRRVFFSPPPNTVERSAISTLALSQSSAPSELAVSAANSIVLSQRSFPPFNEQTVEQTLTLAQERQYNNNAQNALALTQQAFAPEVLRTIEQTLRFRQIVRATTGNIASGRYRR
jgi:hypothetical protein